MDELKSPQESTADPDTRIWRYLDFTKFVYLLDSRALFFARVDTLQDQFEGSFSEANAELRAKAFREKPHLGDLYEKFRRTMEERRKATYVSCWHINEYESFAMWKIYLKSGE